MTERLTTLAAVKQYLNITTDTSDPLLIQSIDAASQFILDWLGWDSFQRTSYVQNFRGYGKSDVLLKFWPILSVSSVFTHGIAVQPSVVTNGLPGSGYVISDRRNGQQAIQLYGYHFGNGSPGQVSYEAGFETTQTMVIPDGTPWQLTPTNKGTWSSDLGVLIDGVEAVLVSADPATGQYAVDEWGTYTFAEDDAGKTVVIAYSYTPAAVSFAAMEIVGLWFKRRDRIGIQSKTLGGQETITYTQEDMSGTSASMLRPFKNVAPI